MRIFSFTSMIACFLFSTIFFAAGCAKKASVAPTPPPVVRMQVEDIKHGAKAAGLEFTYEEISAFRFFFLRE